MKGREGEKDAAWQCDWLRLAIFFFFLIHRFHSISFTRAQGIPKYKIGFGREKDGRVGETLVEGGGGHGALIVDLPSASENMRVKTTVCPAVAAHTATQLAVPTQVGVLSSHVYAVCSIVHVHGSWMPSVRSMPLSLQTPCGNRTSGTTTCWPSV